MTLKVERAADGGYLLSFPYNPALVAAVKDLPRRRFDPATKSWNVAKASGPQLAAMLARITNATVELADGIAEELSGAVDAKRTAVAASRAAAPVDDSVVIPVPDGLAYLPFQEAGIRAALNRPNVLFGDDMGLGKTVQAIGVFNADATIRRVLVVCPASLMISWRNHFAKWSVRPVTIGLANGAFPTTDVVIINYDIIKKHLDAVRSIEWDMLVMDEAHYMKSPTAQRTKFVLGAKAKKGKPETAVPAIRARRKLALTGTPIPNRPIEGWTLFNALAPDVFSSWWGYGTRYCQLTQGRYGVDVKGASNLDELQDVLRASIMIRRRKADVLTELPAKRRQVIEVRPSAELVETIEAEKAAAREHEAMLESLRNAVDAAEPGSPEYKAAVDALRQGFRVAFTEMSKVRHEVAVATVPYAVAHIQDVLDATETGKLLVFAHHIDVVDALVAAFPGAVKITGDTPKGERQNVVDAFQTDPSIRVFVGNIQAAGVGLTLTAAAHVVFAELDWVPGNVTQAEDRAHRIGQTEQVLVQHLVLEGSLSATMAKRLVEKQNVIDAALDTEHPERDTPIDLSEPERVEKAKKIAADAPALPSEQVAAIHAGLRILSANCDGARMLDGHGFNGRDTAFGKMLAALPMLTQRQAAVGFKMVRLYHRQLPAALLAAAGVEPKGK